MAIAITNIGVNSGTGVTTLNLPLGASVPAGAAIVVGVTEFGTAALGGSMADNAGTGNTYSSLTGGDLNNLTTNGFINIFGVSNNGGMATGNIITYTAAVASSPKCITGMYITGVATSAFDTAASAFAGGSSRFPSVTSGTPANSNNFAIGFSCGKVIGSFTQAAGGWGTPPTAEGPGGSFINIQGGSLQTSGSGTTTYNPTFGLSTAWGACIIELIVASGISGSAALLEIQDTLSASGGVLVSGAAVLLEIQDALSASGGVLVSGAGALFEIQDVLAAAGNITLPAITGSAALTELQDLFAGTGDNGQLQTGGHFIPLTRKQVRDQQKRLRRERKLREEEFAARRSDDEGLKQALRGMPALEIAPIINAEPEDDDEDSEIEALLLYG